MSRVRLLRSLLAVSLVSRSLSAVAQDGADAARRALINDARIASRAGDHPRAIELATRAEALRATPSLRHFLAREHLSLGHAVEALSLAGECVARTRDDTTVPDRATLLARCEALVVEVEPRVARLTVRAPSPAPEGLRVTVAGDPLAPPLYDVAVPRMPGIVEVSATADGATPFQTSVTLTASARAEVVLVLPPREPPAPPAPAPAPLRVVRLPETPPPVVTPPPSYSPGAGPWILGGSGVATLIVGAVVGGVALGALSARDAACPSANNCDVAAATEHDQRYRELALGANVAFGVGGALVVGAAAWWIVARVTHRPAAHVAAAPGGVVLRW